MLAANIIKAEDAVRVAGLNTETAARLQAATRGATEESLTSWKWFIEQQVRSQLQDVTPQNVKQRLDGIQDFIFPAARLLRQAQGLQGVNGDQGLWEKTVDVELDAKQKEAWKKETDARQAFRDKTVAALVMAEFDRKDQLTTEQWDKLEPIITGTVRDYSPDISRIFGGINRSLVHGAALTRSCLSPGCLKPISRRFSRKTSGTTGMAVRNTPTPPASGRTSSNSTINESGPQTSE